jgi:hypothetical protein
MVPKPELWTVSFASLRSGYLCTGIMQPAAFCNCGNMIIAVCMVRVMGKMTKTFGEVHRGADSLAEHCGMLHHVE